MSNQFPEKPDLGDTFPRLVDTWTCPITGLSVPKDPDENLKWRAEILALAEEDEQVRQDLYTACGQSLIFWVNAFVMTLRFFEPKTTGGVQQAQTRHIPMVTWENIQDPHLLRIEHAIDHGEDLLTDKSRDMGATWDHLIVLIHKFLFEDDFVARVISNKEDNVDQLSGRDNMADPSTLFGKIDYVLSFLPEWMQPVWDRKRMHIVNKNTNARIDGESANANAGTSGRFDVVFLDEMSKMDHGESIKRSTADTTACRLVCSTPNGAGTAYSKWRLSGTIAVFVLPWWEHPEKGRGRYLMQDDLGRWKIRSPWYDGEAERRSPKELAIEVDMDHVGSGDTFFEAMVIEEHKMMFAGAKWQDRRRTMTINFHKKVPDADIPGLLQKKTLSKIHTTPRGKWLVWCSLVKGRPDQSKSYTVGVDIGKGMGASNSVISILCNETREKIAEFACAATPPYELARIACAACLWAGGASRALLIWENNGDPGFDFGNMVVRTYEYPNIYFDRQAGTVAQKQGKRFGWRSNREKKAEGLGILRRAYAHGGIINHSVAALQEALTYVHYDSGGIGPSELLEESESARATHGDRVIADMLCLIGAGKRLGQKVAGAAAPTRSAAGRMKAWKKRKKNAAQSRSFDWRAA